MDSDCTSRFPAATLASPVTSVRPSNVRRCREPRPRKSSSSRSQRPTKAAAAGSSGDDTIRLKIFKKKTVKSSAKLLETLPVRKPLKGRGQVQFKSPPVQRGRLILTTACPGGEPQRNKSYCDTRKHRFACCNRLITTSHLLLRNSIGNYFISKAP